MSESQDGIVRMIGTGTLARVTFHPDGRYELQEILQKSALAGPTLKEIGDLIASMPGTDEGGGQGNYGRLDLR